MLLIDWIGYDVYGGLLVEASDLLIFQKRAKPEDKIQVVPKSQTTPAQAQPAPQQVKWRHTPKQQGAVTQPKQPEENKVKIKTVKMKDVEWPMYKPEAPLAGTPEIKLSNVSPKMPLTVAESLKQAEGQFCVNHPWRHAYAVCNVCRLPYCYIDVMEDRGKIYCLNDIDIATRERNTEKVPETNIFSIMSSVMFLINSVVLGYFTYQQTVFIAKSAIDAGIIKFFLHLNTSYYFPLANVALIFLGLASAITILRKNTYGVGLSIIVSAGGLLIVLYEYLYSSVQYLFISCILLILSLTLIAYSRMSSIKEIAEQEQILAPDIEWPRPEAF